MRHFAGSVAAEDVAAEAAVVDLELGGEAVLSNGW